MFIINSELVSKRKFNKTIAKYLVKKNIPLLSRDDDGFYFAQTEELNNILKSLPWYFKVLL